MGGLGAEIDASLTVLSLHGVQAVDVGFSQPGVTPSPGSAIVSADVYGAMIGAGEDQAADRLLKMAWMCRSVSVRSVIVQPDPERSIRNDALIRADEDI